MTPLLETFRRYHAMITALLPERWYLLPRNYQPAHTPLVLYDDFRNLNRDFERMPATAFMQEEQRLRGELERLESSSDWVQATSLGALTALAIYAGGIAFSRDASVELAQHAFGQLVKNQSDSGRWFSLDPAASPEASWFDELATLHAAASYAVQAEDRHVARAVAKSSSFIQREIEPDHATGQPWGLFAFIWNEQTRPLADQMLHSVEMRKNELDGATLILLRDALYCLGLFH